MNKRGGWWVKREVVHIRERERGKYWEGEGEGDKYWGGGCEYWRGGFKYWGGGGRGY